MAADEGKPGGPGGLLASHGREQQLALDIGEDHDRDGILDVGNRIDLDYVRREEDNPYDLRRLGLGFGDHSHPFRLTLGGEGFLLYLRLDLEPLPFGVLLSIQHLVRALLANQLLLPPRQLDLGLQLVLLDGPLLLHRQRAPLEGSLVRLLLDLLAHWGDDVECAPWMDVNGDGTINSIDLTALLAAWGDCP